MTPKAPAAKKASKYGAKKTVVDGIEFASKAEARFYGHLKLLERQGLISGLELQPRFELVPAVKLDGKTKRALVYVADFRYRCEATGATVIADVKGVATQAYKIKRHLMKHLHGIEVKEVRA
jgi:hypothetical protein